jgi:putative hydrolase of the HAD superfamily
MSVEQARIQAVLFDLGGTLVDGRDYEGWAADGRALGLDLDAEAIARAWVAAEPWVNHREESRESLWREILSGASSSQVAESLVRRFLERQDAKPIQGSLFSDVRRCLELLRRGRRRLGIVSNSRSEPAVRGLLKTLEIESEFELVVSSGTEGVRKPDPEIFRRSLKRIRVPPAETLFVGDDLENDVKGALSAGLHAVWLNRLGTGEEGPFPEILSLSEVPRILRLIEAGAPVK